MKLNVKEPAFSAATILLGEEIADQLISSSHKARPRWAKLFQEYEHAIPDIVRCVQMKLRAFPHPLVRAFISEWVRNFSWDVYIPDCRDAVGVKVPSAHLECLTKFGGVENFSFMLGDVADLCCASLGNNDHNRKFGLIINCPAWVKLASYEQFQWSFDRQIRMVVQHEMAHFRYQAGDRAEVHAHCRGIASLLWRESDLNSCSDFPARLQQDFQEIAANEIIKSLVLSQGKVTWRLVRFWMYLFKKHLHSRTFRQNTCNTFDS